MIGQSAHSGTGAKVGYYAHGVQTKREQTLSEKSPRCTPFRIPAKKLEERVWKEVVELIRGEHREGLYKALKALEHENPSDVSLRKKQTELDSVQSKIKNLAHRITELPAGVPADAFYSEMKSLNETNTRVLSEIRSLEQKNSAQEIATESQYERFLEKLKSALPEENTITPEIKRRIIQTLVAKVVTTKAGFKMHFYAGSDQTKKGGANASPLISFNKNFSVPSSLFLLNGGSGENRTLIPLRIPDFESGASTNSATEPLYK